MSPNEAFRHPAGGVIKGWLIATTLGVGVLFLLVMGMYGVPILRSETDAGHLWGVGLAVLFYGYGIALVVRGPLAWVLAYLLCHRRTSFGSDW